MKERNKEKGEKKGGKKERERKIKKNKSPTSHFVRPLVGNFFKTLKIFLVNAICPDHAFAAEILVGYTKYILSF